MKKFNALLVFSISGLVITGVSFINGKIWDVIFIGVGMADYAIVGAPFLIGVLHGKETDKETYAFVFFLLLLASYGVYKGLEKLRLWILAWPLVVKNIVTIMVALLIGVLNILYIMKRKRNNAV